MSELIPGLNSNRRLNLTVPGLSHEAKLDLEQLACALYEGIPGHLYNLAEKLARQHGRAGALTFFDMQDDDVRNFWVLIARLLVDHARGWDPNEGSACVLTRDERVRLANLPRAWSYGVEITVSSSANLKAMAKALELAEFARMVWLMRHNQISDPTSGMTENLEIKVDAWMREHADVLG